MAWISPSRSNFYSVEMLDKNGKSLGLLDGFESGSVTYEYETDMKRIATLSTRNDNYIRNSLLRIRIDTSDGDFANLGVFIVKDIKAKIAGEVTVKDYDLTSLAYKLETSMLTHRELIVSLIGAYYFFDHILPDGTVNFQEPDDVRKLVHDYGAEGHVFEAGTKRLDILKDCCHDYNLRYLPHDWFIEVQKSVDPKTLPPVYTFDYETGRQIEGDITINDSSFTTVNQAISVYKNNNIELVGVAQAPSSSIISPGKRNQFVSEKFDETTCVPETQERINALAKYHIDRAIPAVYYEFDGIYCGLKDGDVVTLNYNETSRKCLVYSMQINLSPAMKCHYKLKDCDPNVWN